MTNPAARAAPPKATKATAKAKAGKAAPDAIGPDPKVEGLVQATAGRKAAAKPEAPPKPKPKPKPKAPAKPKAKASAKPKPKPATGPKASATRRSAARPAVVSASPDDGDDDLLPE